MYKTVSIDATRTALLNRSDGRANRERARKKALHTESGSKRVGKFRGKGFLSKRERHLAKCERFALRTPL